MRPRRDRPQVAAEYGFATGEEGLLDWEMVSDALGRAATYWLATIRPDGRPHATPIWGAWTGDGLHFEGGDTTRWAKNLASSAELAVGVEQDGYHMVLEGHAHLSDLAGSELKSVADGYKTKYGYRPQGRRFWRLAPVRVRAFKVNDLESFARTPTRFSFVGPE